MKDLALRIAKRFARAFVAGFIAGVTTFLATGTPIRDFKDIQVLAFPLVIAGITGALMSLDKALRDVPEES